MLPHGPGCNGLDYYFSDACAEYVFVKLTEDAYNHRHWMAGVYRRTTNVLKPNEFFYINDEWAYEVSWPGPFYIWYRTDCQGVRLHIQLKAIFKI